MTDISKEAVESFIQDTVKEWVLSEGLPRNADDTKDAYRTVTLLRGMSAVIADQDAKIAELEAAIKRQASASKTLRNLTLNEVQHLKDKDRSEYTAAKTVDSEREANAILTEELEERDAKIAKLVEALRGVTHSLGNRMIGMDKARDDAAQALASIGETDD